MFSAFLAHHLHAASYKILDDGTYFGEIPGLDGVWANAATLEACRDELNDVLESWVVVKLRHGEAVPGLEDKAYA